MSLIKLKKSNRRPIPVPQNQRQHKPVFLGDSIGKRLQQQSYHIQHREISWWCGWGRNSNKAVKWMKDNLETELTKKYGCMYSSKRATLQTSIHLQR